MRSTRSLVAAVGILMVVALAPSGAAVAATNDVIEVFPGPNAINNALDLAAPGDVLNIHAGTYPEQVSVRVDNVTLRSAGDGTVTVDGGCSVATTLDVRAERVTVRGLRVIGAGVGFSPIAIDFSGIRQGRVMSSVVEDTCGDAWYGINVYQGGSIRILNNTASGFDDAGIYVGDITSTPFGAMLIRGNESFGNVKGVIVQEISAATTVQVLANDVHDNDNTGIWLNLADGVGVGRNELADNGERGIDLDLFSDGNLIRDNVASGHTFDLYDGGGSGNCWTGNVYTTSFGDISC